MTVIGSLIPSVGDTDCDPYPAIPSMSPFALPNDRTLLFPCRLLPFDFVLAEAAPDIDDRSVGSGGGAYDDDDITSAALLITNCEAVAAVFATGVEAPLQNPLNRCTANIVCSAVGVLEPVPAREGTLDPPNDLGASESNAFCVNNFVNVSEKLSIATDDCVPMGVLTPDITSPIRADDMASPNNAIGIG